MVLSEKEVYLFENGKLTKSIFKKLLNTIDFDKYILRYYNAIEDYRIEQFNMRVRTFHIFNYEIEITYELGECTRFTYKKL